jgi:hypothetical protein
MPVNITAGVEVSVSGGPSLRVSQSVPVEAYDVVDLVVADGALDRVVEVQPSAAASRVQFLLVMASQYDSALSYRVNSAASPSNPLDRPLLLAGVGAVGLLGAVPGSLLFSNATGADVTVQVIVGRDATP